MHSYRKKNKQSVKEKVTGRSVEVYNGNIEQALRKFKKKVADSEVLMVVREKETFTKPSIQRKIARAVAKKRWQKYVEKTSLKRS